MAKFTCTNCNQEFESEHDVELVIDQDTNRGSYVCYDCIIGQQTREWLRKQWIQVKEEAQLKKQQSL